MICACSCFESHQKKLAPHCYDALSLAAPYLKQGYPVPFSAECPKLCKFRTFWIGRFVTPQFRTKQYTIIKPAEQAAIDSLGLTHIVSGMRDGTLHRFNPEGLPGQVWGNSPSRGTKCTICGTVAANYSQHLHVNVSGVEGADEPGAPMVADSPAEVCVPRSVAASAASVTRVV